MDIVIERANVNDSKQLIDVQNKSFYEDYEKYGNCPAYNEPEERILELIENNIVYKILADGEIIGDIIIRIRENQNYYLRVIAVIPEYWNQGIGSKAMKYIEENNPEAKKWSLITPHQSFRNHHFYEKIGYKKVGEIIDSEKLTLWKYEKEID
ncbi:MAG: GNAT family N-acetyltransferase [Clostridiaceae bacterium]|nr:GNAT family N-acetyltransferase [Clostridiaceae bacterium]